MPNKHYFYHGEKGTKKKKRRPTDKNEKAGKYVRETDSLLVGEEMKIK